MKVLAKTNGFYGSYREAGTEFDAEDGAKASWFVPVKTEKTKAEKPEKHESAKAEKPEPLV